MDGLCFLDITVLDERKLFHFGDEEQPLGHYCDVSLSYFKWPLQNKHILYTKIDNISSTL